MTAETLFPLVPWVVLIPLAGILINLLAGRALGERGVGLVASLAALGSFAVSVLLAVGLAQQPEGQSLLLARWMSIGSLNVDWAFRVDTLSVTMMLVVSGVGTLIHIYSIGYMHDDTRHNGDPARFHRFFLYLNLFIAAMMVLVSADNYLMMFVGWEGVGLCSYLLIGFWFEKGEAGLGNARAAKKAFVVNRIGDLGFLIAMFTMFWAFGSLSFGEVLPRAAEAAPAVLLAITLFFLLAVTGKSAQLPLFTWLPDAMAGPTPVSALIHAATMVTAGVYLVARSLPIFAAAPAAQSAVLWVGALTALFAATIAVAQTDIKRVLAFSTISQLGFMVAAVGMGAVVAGMFHLITHAFFKALLFLGAGSVILGMERGHERHAQAHDGHHGGFDPQDMRFMGGLRSRMPVTFWVYLIGGLALAGVAPLSGFFSKDEILAAAEQVSPAVFVVLLIAALLTAFYVARQLALVFFGQGRSEAARAATESSPVITVPLGILAALAAVGGALNLPGSHLLGDWLHHTVEPLVEAGFNPLTAGIALVIALAGLGLGWLLYGRSPLTRAEEPDPLAVRLKGLFTWLRRKWYVDEIYNALFVTPYTRLSQMLAGPVDQGLIDGVVNGAGGMARLLGNLGRSLQNGYVRSYALIMLVGVALIFTFLLAR